MFQNVELFIKFWFEVKKTDAYIRNCVITNSIIDKKEINFIKVFTEIQSFINYLRI